MKNTFLSIMDSPVRNNKTFLLHYILIAVITLAAYYPSLYHMPRSDQFIYFTNTAEQHDLLSLTVKNYAFNRMDLSYGLKDELLFRPFIYAFLGFEKWLFGLTFFYWQLAGILLHLTVLWFLMRLLIGIHKSWWASLLTLFLGVLFAGSEMVVWSHINGYLIFITCALIALDQTLKVIKKKRPRVKNLLGVGLALIFAVFTHEFGVIFSFFLGIYFYSAFKSDQNTISVKKTISIIYFLPVLLYFFFSFLDFTSRNLELSAQSSFSLRHIINACSNTAATLFWWLHSGLFPSRVFTEIGQRTFMYPLYIDFSGKPSLTSLTVFQTLTSVGLILVYLAIIVTHSTKIFMRQRWKSLCLLFCLFSFYAFIVSLGRISALGFERILVENPYYHYFFWVFFIIFIYSLIPFDHMKVSSHTVLQTSFLALFIILIIFNFRFTSKLVSMRAHKARFQRVLNQDIQDLIKKRAKEKNFSFSIDPAINQSTYYLHWAKRDNDPDDKEYNYFKLLYPKHYKEISAEYIYTQGKNGRWGWRETGY